MPDATGKLTTEDQDLVRKWLEDHQIGGLTPKCALCGTQGWEIPEYVIRDWTLGRGGGLIVGVGAPIYPHVPVMCQTCGYTMFFNAIQIGLIPRDAAVPKKETENG